VLIRDVDAQAVDLEGYLFPETYALPRAAPASRLIALMVDRFRATYTDEWRRTAEAQGFTTRQVVTLASLVEKETGKAEERPIVATVYRNRLKIGGPPGRSTVVYALRRPAYAGNIRQVDHLDSPIAPIGMRPAAGVIMALARPRSKRCLCPLESVACIS
jgi:UPF0755 protein